MRSSARLCALIVAVAVTSASVPVVHAQTAAEIAAARELFEEGLKLEEKGQWGEALERFRKVAAVKMTPQVRFHIALCLENTGKLVDALVEFQRAQSDAEASGATVVAQSSAKHVGDLKERIPRLLVKIPSGVDGVTLSIDGVQVAASLVNTAIPLDPGAHKVSVQAPGRTTFNKDVELVERGKTTTLEASLPVAAANTVVDDDGKPDDPPPGDKPSGGGGSSALPWIFGGLGVAALAGGGVMYYLRQGTIRDLEDQCGPTRSACPESARSIADRGKTYTTYGNVLLGVGVLSVATAAVLFIVIPSGDAKSTSSTKSTLAIGNGPGLVGLSLSGTF